MIKKMAMILLSTSFLLSGCENILEKSIIPEEIVEAAIETNEKEEDYYIKSNIKIFEKGELIEDISSQEWRAKVDGEIKRRTEMISKDGEKTISLSSGQETRIYQEGSNEVFTVTSERDEVFNLNKSVKEKTMYELDTAKKMYDIKELGEETINGRETYHLRGEPKKESSLLGQYDIWIDKDNWVVMKSISESGDIEVISENKEVNFSPEIESSIFKLDMPEDVKEIDMNEEISPGEELSVEEANEKLGGRLIYINDDDYKLEKATWSTYDSDLIPDEMVFNYRGKNSQVFFISVLENRDDMEDDGVLEFQERDIRGNKAYIMDDVLKMITFFEDGLQYNLIIEEEGMTIDDAVELIEGMEKYKK